MMTESHSDAPIDLPSTFDLPARAVEDHVRRLSNAVDRDDRRDRRFTFRPSAAVALVLTALLVTSGAALAVRFDIGPGFLAGADESSKGDPSSPHLLGERVRIATTNDRAIYAWKSTRGICVAAVAQAGRGASGCGFPVIGSPNDVAVRQPEPNRFVGGVASREGSQIDVVGVAAEAVARVDVELADGSVLRADMWTAPKTLETPLRVFYVRARAITSVGESGMQRHVAALVAYDRDGKQLDRLGF